MKHRLAVIVLAASTAAFAHPMGEASVNHYARFEARAGGIDFTYALDLGETASAGLLREWSVDRTADQTQLEAKARTQAAHWLAGLRLTVDGKPVFPRLDSAAAVIGEGDGRRPVVRITARASIDATPGKLDYEDRNYRDQPGWKEIVIAAGPGVTVSRATHPAADLSKALTVYPEGSTAAPPGDVKATFEWAAGAGEAAPDTLSQLLGRKELSLSVILLALATAFGLGSVHALSPGHGKTIVAAYLVGSRGTFKHAIALGAMVTFTHTVSVFLLGLGTLFLSRYIVPDKIIPVLSVISGLMIVWIGGTLFFKRLNRLAEETAPQAPHHHHHDHDHEHEMAHAHSHGHSHDHAHHHHHDGHDHDHGHDHHHGPGGHTHVIEGEVTMGSLVGLAVSGGMVPCPSALVLLLSAMALGRIAFGLALLTAFSLGLAMVLIAIGCAVLYAKNLLPDTPRVTNHPFFKVVPVLSAAVITIAGLVMTAVAAGLVKPAWN